MEIKRTYFWDKILEIFINNNNNNNNNMKKGVFVFGFFLVISLSLVSAFSFGDLWGKITGEAVDDFVESYFDNVEVLYAANVIVYPENVEPDSWIVELAGGVDKNLSILYGVVNLTKEGQQVAIEEFIKVSNMSNANLYERFLRISGGFTDIGDIMGYPDDIILANASTVFSSAKKIENNQVVKTYPDTTIPNSLKELHLLRGYVDFIPPQTELYKFILNGNYNDVTAPQGETIITGTNEYIADLSTLTQTGDPTALAR